MNIDVKTKLRYLKAKNILSILRKFNYDYLLITFLALPLLLPLLGRDIAYSFNPTINILKSLTGAEEQLAEGNYKKSIQLVQDNLDKKFAEQPELDVNVDVEAVVDGDNSSIVSNPNLTLRQKANLIVMVSMAQQSTFATLENSTDKATQSSYLHHPGDAVIGNSLQDVKTELESMQSTLEDEIEMMEDINKLYKGLQLMMSAKNAFLPEKYDVPEDYFNICTALLPGDGTEIYPKLAENVDLSNFRTDANVPYEALLEEFKGTTQAEELIKTKYDNIKGEDKDKLVQIYEGEIPASVLNENETSLDVVGEVDKAILEVSNQTTENSISTQLLTQLTMMENMRKNYSQELDLAKDRQEEMQYLVLINQLINLIDQQKSPTP